MCVSVDTLDYRFSIELDKSRELEIGIYWRDWRSLCAVKFLRLEEFIDDVRHGMALQLEPQGLLFAEVMFSTGIREQVYFYVCVYVADKVPQPDDHQATKTEEAEEDL